MTGLKYSPDRGKGGRWNSRKKPGSIKSQARRSKMMNYHVSFVLGLCNEVKSSCHSCCVKLMMVASLLVCVVEWNAFQKISLPATHL